MIAPVTTGPFKDGYGWGKEEGARRRTMRRADAGKGVTVRNMSFAMTTEQFKNRTKTVTRRFGWWFLNPEDVVMGVEKAMGLKKGEKIVRLGPIQIITTWPEPLDAITPEDVIKEGFPTMTPGQFIDMFVKHYKCSNKEQVNRIEYGYLD